ncbi:MAG: DMT family transporter [Akkermansiaceae bacterium]|nr:DMT family transporter [Akkermansiaceae bacterium]NNM28091.1 DMT family transporter [Akkermansiaceae bacterium]
MTLGDGIRLIVLSAIWGASFMLVRIAAPEFGPIPLIFVRVGVAALVFLPIVLRPANRALLRRHAGVLLAQGALNSALPFTLMAWAMLSLEAGFTSLLNATTPIFAALIAFAWLKIPLNRLQVLGLLLGIAGIAILAWDRLSFRPGGSGWAVLAVLAGTMAYAGASNFAKVRLAGVHPLIVSGGSLLGASLLLLPFTIPLWPAEMPSPLSLVSALVLAVVCTAFGFFLFFDLLTRTGATAATTVTFIIPIFGILWGALFLGERVTVQMIAGMIVALGGTALVTRVIRRREILP